MRALGALPTDPLLKTMTPIQWQMCMLNVAEDERETNEKIKTLTDIAIKLFVGDPKKEGEEEDPGNITQEGYIGEEPSKKKPDIAYTVKGRDGEDMSIRKVMSTEYDKIVQSGGKNQGFDVVANKPKEKKNA